MEGLVFHALAHPLTFGGEINECETISELLVCNMVAHHADQEVHQ
jgi:hypothetical protein